LYLKRNDLREAEQAFKTAADLAPPRSPMRTRYADFLIRTGASAEAKNILEEINRKAPDYLPPRVLLMNMPCAEHQDDDCATRVQNILSQDPLNQTALFRDGLINLVREDTTKAIREFEYLANNSSDPLVRYQLAVAYLQNAKNTDSETNRREAVQRAERILKDAIELNPRLDQANVLLAELMLRKGNPAAAVDLLAPLTKERPQVAPAQFLVATSYLAEQKLDQALAVYRQMTELFPKDPRPPFLAGNILLGRGQQSDARQAFEKSVEISPGNLPATEKLVDLDIAGKQYPVAIERVQKLIDKDPNLAQLWGLRAKIYLAQNDLTHAEADLLKTIELDPAWCRHI